jgi:hypothetical protein
VAGALAGTLAACFQGRFALRRSSGGGGTGFAAGVAISLTLTSATSHRATKAARWAA